MEEFEFESLGSEDTYNFGKRLGKSAKMGEIYCLDGDLGTGKTVFTKGFAEGLDIKEVVNSPTFTIIQIYEDGRLPLYHFDVYRITDLDDMDEIGYEDYFYGAGVTMIEWAAQIEDLVPDTAKHIEIKKDLSKDMNYRKIRGYCKTGKW